MPIDGPVDHPGDRAGADAAESAAGRRGCGVRRGSVFPCGAHRSGAATPAAEGTGCKAREGETQKTEEEKREDKVCTAGRADAAQAGGARLAGTRSSAAEAARAAAAAGICVRCDPYDTALAFGCVNAALGALTPLAERTLCIDERDIQTGVDFDAERPRIDARIVCTIRIGQIVAVALIFGVGYLKQKLQAKKARAARAKTAPDTQERKVSNG